MAESTVPSWETLTVDRRGAVLWVTLNRPEKLNAMNAQLKLDFDQCLLWAQEDETSRVVVITGAGRGFCSGGDVNGQVASKDGYNKVERDPYRVTSRGRGLIATLMQMEKPVIAMVNGPAVGLGASIALLCDIIVMADNATIGDRHINTGLVPGDGGAVIMPLLVGVARAKELLMTGRLLSGKEAAEIGLVTRSVPADELETVVSDYAHQLAELPPFALRATKAAVNTVVWAQAERMMELTLAWEHVTLQSPEYKALAQQFVEARAKSGQKS